MLGSPVIDVAIGMTFIFLALSLIASAIQEILSLQITVKGEGTIYVQDGAEVMIEVDKRNTKLTHEAIPRLERKF
jgi:hypothetical protein